MSAVVSPAARIKEPDPPPGVPVKLPALGRDLLAAVPPAERQLAERVPVAMLHHLSSGQWSPTDLGDGAHRTDHAALILQGTIVRNIALGGRASSHLHGPGDLLRPWRGVDTVLPGQETWICWSRDAQVAVLGDRFSQVAARWPRLSILVRERLADQLDRATMHTAILSLPRAEQRILALLWQLAERWGTVTPAGVVLRIDLTHELLGRLVGARRPTVSLALQALAEDRSVERLQAGAWLLSHDSARRIGSPSE